MLFLVLCTFSEDEQVWIEQLFNENHTLLYKVSYQLLQSETDAEDAVAQAFLNIMESASYHAATRFPIVLLLQRMHPMIFFVRRKR